MAVWAIADLHLSFGVSGKRMDRFGPAWIDHHQKIAANWRACVAPDDLVLIAGDISWALRLTEALPDLQWLDALPGEKLLVRGNHDLWWPKSRTKLAGVLPGSLHFLHRNAFRWRNLAVAGSRLWDIPGLRFDAILQASESDEARGAERANVEYDDEKILAREVGRLRASLEQLDPDAEHRICMTHFPPLAADLRETEIAWLIESFQIDAVVFGHLHHVRTDLPLFGTRNRTRYLLTSCDFLDFTPVRICD